MGWHSHGFAVCRRKPESFMNGAFTNRSCAVCDALSMSAPHTHAPTAFGIGKVFLALALLCCLATGAVLAQDRPARLPDAVRGGQLLPLAHFNEHALRHFGGRVIEVELEREREGMRYELELLLEDGRVVDLTYDAASGQLLEVEGHRLETVFGRGGRPYP